MSEEQAISFEEAMKKLEGIVSKLEEGDVPLEQAINYFQEGMKLSKLCHDKLQNVEKQMDQILKEDGKLEPFSIQEEE
ncbi:exodeoxyribonuclease VII small subunit [Litchfieldia salsa]|uniref:Exodeoxyribonuclease 7 small subunit n=1 Tax=Litchfieldia salsa TaxID=930152 RepID=A0A1H0WIR0_9BACI|nr:exodeoxyribonuclease VII small subunit [Litchfieldia salsa]SDP90473.1 Exodeoxyribonuclease VII small subunit [Litchfieldia salsa]